MQERVCERWGTQTTAIDIAKQNSEVTGSPPPPRGGDCKGGRDFKRGGVRTFNATFPHLDLICR